MADAFEDRGKGFERKYQLDEELAFKVQSRRDKLFGLWLAAEFGFGGDEAETYAREVVISNLEKPGDEDMFDKVKADIQDRNIIIEEKILRLKLQELAEVAHRQVLDD